VKADWKSMKLGEVCEIIMGQSPDGSSYNVIGEGVPLINGPVEFSQEAFGKTIRSKFTIQPTKLCKKDDLILCVRGSTTGRMNIAGFDACIGRGVAVIRSREYQPWINHFISWKRDEIHQLGTGATFPNVSGTMLGNLGLFVPPLAEQKRIVGILDEAFDGIDTAKANAGKNLQNAGTLFESYLQFVFERRGTDWVEKPLGTFATFRNGINYTKDSKGESVKIVGVKDFQKSFWVPSQNLDTVTIDGKLSESDLLRQGDILAVRSNGNPELIGRCILAGKIPEKMSHSGFTIRIRLSNGDLLPDYLCHFMKCASSRKRLTDSGTGTNIKSLNQQTLSALRIPFPPASKQKAIVARLESISEETQRLKSIYEQKLTALEELKKSVLQKAFTEGL
jgi:type I restriction enzyme S subunit